MKKSFVTISLIGILFLMLSCNINNSPVSQPVIVNKTAQPCEDLSKDSVLYVQYLITYTNGMCQTKIISRNEKLFIDTVNFKVDHIDTIGFVPTPTWD